MASQLTEYERHRLDNIKRNNEMMDALKLQSKLSEIISDKRQRIEMQKSNRIGQAKKEYKPDVIRKSLRTRGMPPDPPRISPDSIKASIMLRHIICPRTLVLGPIGFRDPCLKSNVSESDVEAFTESVLSISNGSSTGLSELAASCKFELESLRLEPDNVARVASSRVYAVKFFPTHDLEMVVAGDERGNVGFWDMASKDEGNCVYRYRLHSACISGISVHPFSMSKVYTSSCDGMVRVTNMDKQVLTLYIPVMTPFIPFLKSQMMRTPFILVKVERELWDERMGKTPASWVLHKSRINSIDFNSANTNIMATGSTDGTAFIWDLRKMEAEKSVRLKAIEHKSVVTYAYFSTSGINLATTSGCTNGSIGMVSGKNFEDVSMMHHDNQTRTSPTSFSAIWGWDDTHLYIGNKSRGVDIMSVGEKKIICTLRSEHMTTVSCRFDTHPWKAGVLAGGGAAGGGQVFVWTPPSL